MRNLSISLLLLLLVPDYTLQLVWDKVTVWYQNCPCVSEVKQIPKIHLLLLGTMICLIARLIVD